MTCNCRLCQEDVVKLSTQAQDDWSTQMVKPSTQAPQPMPVYKGQEPFVWDLVLQDMMERDKIGEERYNTRLQPNNGRNALIDAYQEALDLVVYLRQAIYEQTGK